MAKIRIEPDGTQTVLSPGLPYKSVEGLEIEGIVSDYFEGPDIAVVEIAARACHQKMVDANWWKTFCISVVSDDDYDIVIGYSVEGYRTAGRHTAFRNAIRRANPERQARYDARRAEAKAKKAKKGG